MKQKNKDKSWKKILQEKVHGRIRYRIRKQLERDGDKEVKQYSKETNDSPKV